MNPWKQNENEQFECCLTPRHDLVRQAGVFLIEHAAHDITFEIPTGMTHGVFAACGTCHWAIHYPMLTENADPLTLDT